MSALTHSQLESLRTWHLLCVARADDGKRLEPQEAALCLAMVTDVLLSLVEPVSLAAGKQQEVVRD